MSKFRFIITDTFDGVLLGTNDMEKACDAATSVDFFVYDTEKDVWLTAGYNDADGVTAEPTEIEEWHS